MAPRTRAQPFTSACPTPDRCAGRVPTRRPALTDSSSRSPRRKICAMQLSTDRTRSSERTQARTLHHLARFIGATDDDLSARIQELEQEWAVERVFEAKAAGLTLL